MLKANASQVKDLDLKDLKSVFERMKHMGRGDNAHRPNTAMLAAVGAAAVGATFMYFFDPAHGESRRSSARERVTQWHLSGRGRLDHGRRQRPSESPSVDLSEEGRSAGDPEDMRGRTPSDGTAELTH